MTNNHEAGKGSKPRPYDQEAWDKNFDAIFRKPELTEEDYLVEKLAGRLRHRVQSFSIPGTYTAKLFIRDIPKPTKEETFAEWKTRKEQEE